jgi:hypothetical protein
MPPYPLVERYTGTLLGADLALARPGETLVVASLRRLQPEKSYYSTGEIHQW